MHDCAAMRAARSNSRTRIFPDADFGFERAKYLRWLLISLKAARIFLDGILANHFSPFRQNNSRSSGLGAAMTVPSGVSFGADTPSFLCAKPSLNPALATLPDGSSNTSRLKTEM